MERKRFLIVEDHEITSNAVADYLKMFFSDWDFSQATTEQDAIQRIFKEHPDVVILDIALPGGDGLEVVRSVGKSDLPVKPQFVIITALGDKATHGPRPGTSWVNQLEENERKLVSAFFEKPYSWKEFLMALAKAGGVPIPKDLLEFQELI